MRTGWGLLVVGTALSGCIPSRDNPKDPSVAPRARLVVVDLGRDADGACLPPVTGLSALVAASRGACLALDASASDDPQNRALDYEYRYLGPGPATAVTSTNAAFTDVMPLPESFRLGLDATPGAIHTFEVTVTDRQGFVDSTETTLAVSNARPVARANAPRSLPLGGLPWAPGEDILVTFDASESADPDGDTLHFAWTLDGIPVGEDAPVVTAAVDPDAVGRHLMRVDVHDNAIVTTAGAAHFVEAAVASVDLVSPEAWILQKNPGSLSRFTSVTTPFAAQHDAAVQASLLRVPGAPRLAVADTHFSDVYTAALPDYDRGPTADYPDFVAMYGFSGVFGEIAADGERGRIWLIATDAPFASLPTDDGSLVDAVAIYDAAGAAVTLATAQPSTTLAFDGNRRLLTAIDSAGCLWLSHFFSHAIARVCSDGTVSTHPVDAGFAVTGLSGRPQTDVGADPEVWAAEVPDPQSSSTHARISRYSGAATIEELSPVELDEPVVYGPAFLPNDQLWLFLPSSGVVRLDAGTLLNAGPGDATLASNEDLATANMLVTDPETGDVWAFADPENTVSTAVPFAHIALDGRGLVFEGETWPQAIDSDGILWYTNANARFLSRTAGPALFGDGALATVPLSGTARASVSIGDVAGAWVYRSEAGFPEPPTIALFANDGRRVRLIGEADRAGTNVLLPELRLFHTAPDGTAAWGYAEDEAQPAIHRFDLEPETPSLEDVGDPATAMLLGSALSLLPERQLLLPFAPDGESAWALTLVSASSAAPIRVVAIDRDGTVHDRFGIDLSWLTGYPSALTEPPLADRSPATNRLCVVTQVGGNASVQWVNPPGVEPAVEAAGPGFNRPGAIATGVAAVWDPDYGDICVVTWSTGCTGSNSSTIELFYCDGPLAGCTIQNTHTLTDFDARGVLGVNSNEAWASGYGCGSGEPQAQHRVGFTTSFYDLPVGEGTLLRP